MSTPAVNQNPRLAALVNAGVSPWLDQIRRSLIETGELDRMIDEESLRGVTSNPAIFEKAILGSNEYDDQVADLAREGADSRRIFREIAQQDVGMACDVMRRVYDATDGLDGYVSLEVDPDLAFNMDDTLAQAREYWENVDRPNLMIKVPATDEGIPAVEELISEGINVNVTLLFKVEQYEKVAYAYIHGLERRLKEGKPVSGIASVASFFVSRVDSETDKRLDKLGRDDLKGRAALANARKAYQRFERIFEGDRFADLRAAGAAVQRPLWASTGVKNPEYPDTMYVDGLVAPHTVNTMPMNTLLAVAERGVVEGETARIDPDPDLQALADAGVDIADVTDTLLQAGIDAFVTPMEKLLEGIESKREAVVTKRPATFGSSVPDELEPAIVETVDRTRTERIAGRIWRKDPTVWGAADQPEVANRLGWLSVHETMLEQVDDLVGFAQGAAADGLTDAVLLGMGGSSLAPEVFRRSFETRPGRLRLHVLDSTDAAWIRAVEQQIDPARTLFLVSTKSGGTIETRSLADWAWGLRPDGTNFAAITDPGSSLVDLARERGFRRTFLNDPDIGGRYSALSYFGLVPAALMGVDVRALLEGAGVAAEACSAADPSERNSGLWLGAALATLAGKGYDKLTFVVDDAISSFGVWAEQLVAESTGKHGKGILPVADEPLSEPGVYGDDRVFAYLKVDGAHEDAMRALTMAGHPVFTLPVEGPEDLGRIMFFAEFATAVSGWALGINPFDQPNVQAAKDATSRVLESGGAGDPQDAGDAELRALFNEAGPPDYVAIMGYVQASEAMDAAIAELRTLIRERTKATTTFGYGPRFLHSTGQYHKGGAPHGRFLQLVHEAPVDVDVPGASFSFETLKRAQAAGDLETLRGTGRPAQRVTLTGEDPVTDVRSLITRIKGVL